MTTERELLEGAAKAAGYDLRWHQDGTAYADIRCKGYWGVWNPLKDNADVFMLAVRLNIAFSVWLPSEKDYSCGIATAFFETWDENTIEIPHGSDPYEAGRRVIVTTAYEIWEKYSK